VRVFSHSAESDEDEEPAGRRRSQPPQRILEFDAGTGDVKILGDLEALGEDVEVRDLGGGRFVFAFRSSSPVSEAEEDVLVTGTHKKFIQLHIEHEGEERYLWMGGPRHLTRRFEIPQQGMRQKLDGFSRKLLLASLGILAVGLVLAGAVADRVSAPLRRLAGAAREVGEGALGTRVPEAASGEVGQAITAFNRMSERLAELEAKTRELSARQHLGEIGEIARGLAHSLRNPLNALGLSVEELAAGAREGDGDENPELADSARRQIRRIDRSIRSFLALASQGGGAAEDVDLAELAEDVALEALQDSRGRVRVQVDVIGDAEPGLAPLSAVEPELRAVVQALVVNAVEASPEGGTVTVRLRSADDGRIRLEVEDRGPGLPPEVRDKLFTPHLSTKASGSGMGLFLAHRIATNRYRGRLDLVDLEPTGTRAVLELGGRVEGPAQDGGR
ncbi:MAG: HAMP domain-containing sensor histidine kinase, partial [Thermoanaerobaculia bacterium]